MQATTLDGGPIRRPRFRLKPTSAMHADESPTQPDPAWPDGLRAAVLATLADPRWRIDETGHCRAVRWRLSDLLRAAGFDSADPEVLGLVLASIGEAETRAARRAYAERRRAIRAAKYPHLGPFAADYARVLASRARARKRLATKGGPL